MDPTNPTNSRGSSEASTMGLRERKAINTRQRITNIAMMLFQEHGFDGVTLAEIADAAEVAPRTLSNYFSSKEALVFAWQDTGGDALLDMIGAWPTKDDALTVVSNAILATIQNMSQKEALSLARLIEDTPALRARDQLKSHALEGRLAKVLCAREPYLPAVDARLIAMMALGAYRIAQMLWLEEGGTAHPTGYLQATFASLRERIAPPK